MGLSHLKNYLYIIFIQCGNYIFPLVTLPIVSRIFGPKLLGEYNYVTYIIGYLCLLISYSFNYTGVRRLSRNKDQKIKIFWSIFFSQIIILSLVIIFLSIYLQFSVVKNKDLLLFFICFMSCFSTIFQQNWIFQVFHDFKFITYSSIFSKIIIMLLIIFLIRAPEDIYLYAFILQGGMLLASLGTFIFSLFKYDIGFYIPKLKDVTILLKDDVYIFIVNILGNLYTTTGIVLLGLFTTKYEVGIYTSAQKIIDLVRNFSLIPLNMLIFPILSEAFGKDKERGIELIRRIMPLLIFFSITSFVGLILAGKYIILIFFGHDFVSSIGVLYILSLGYVAVFFGYIIGGQVILNLNLDRDFVIIQVFVAIFSLCFNLLLLPRGGAITTAWIWSSSEIIMTSFQIIYLYKKNIIVFDYKYFKISNMKKELFSMFNRSKQG